LWVPLARYRPVTSGLTSPVMSMQPTSTDWLLEDDWELLDWLLRLLLVLDRLVELLDVED